MSSSTIFLSTVTDEFRSLRMRLAALLQRTQRVHVRHQEGFVATGVKTLLQLQEEVAQSDIVLHVIGAQPGSPPPVEQVEDLVRRLPDLATRFPDLIERARERRVTYTQWEAWLALYFGKRLCGYRLDDRLPPAGEAPAADSPLFGQWEHSNGLGKVKHYPKSVANIDALYDEIIVTLIELKLLTEQEAHRPIKLPYPSLGTLFKGREQFLGQLRDSLQRASDGRATAIVGKAVHGLGGVGKTRLAVEYAWQHADNFSAVLFVTAESPETLRRELAELTGPLVLNLPEQAATEEDVRVAAAVRWLHEHPGWFLILDNVDTEAAAQHVEQFLAGLYKGQVLITSRLAKWNESVEPLELDVLDAADAAQFLLQRTQPKGNRGRRVQTTDEADATQLARDLDSLALALEQAGAYVAHRRISLADYLQLWRKHLPEVQAWHDRTMQYPRSVAVTWQTTLDQLGPREIELLNVLAWFAPEPIPLSAIAPLFQLLAEEQPEPPNDSKRSSITSDQADIQFRESLATLADYSMVRWNIQADSITVHRVVQEILRTRQTDQTKWLTLALRLLDQARPVGSATDVRSWPQWEPLRPHVVFATTEANQRDIAEPTSLLMGELGTLLWGKALYADAEPLMRRALDIDEATYGGHHPLVAIDLNNLAQLLLATNRLAEVEPLMRRAFHIDEAAYGCDHPSVAIRLSNLAQLLQATNRLAEAEPLMRRALDIDEATYGSEHPRVARDLNNLAGLLQATNRLAEAEPLIRRALHIDEAAYGSDHPDVAIRLNNLAQLLRDTNRLTEAEPLMRRALHIHEAAYGSEHPDVARGLNNLALLLKATNRLADCEPLMRRALHIHEAAYGSDHPSVATCLSNLALLLQDTNRLADAEPLMRRALHIHEAAYGSDHPNVATCLSNLALLLQDTNRLADAEPLMRRALHIDEVAYGSEHPSVAIQLNNLALLLEATNRKADAEPLLRRVVEIFSQFGRATGHEHPHMQTVIENYRNLLDAMNLAETDIEAKLFEALNPTADAE